jgi:hypothetical protein
MDALWDRWWAKPEIVEIANEIKKRCSAALKLVGQTELDKSWQSLPKEGLTNEQAADVLYLTANTRQRFAKVLSQLVAAEIWLKRMDSILMASWKSYLDNATPDQKIAEWKVDAWYESHTITQWQRDMSDVIGATAGLKERMNALRDNSGDLRGALGSLGD